MKKLHLLKVFIKIEEHMFESYNQVYLKVMKDLNEKSKNWFISLLDIVETGWDEKLAESMVQQVFPYSYLDEIYTKLLIIHKELYKRLLRVNAKDANYLLYV